MMSTDQMNEIINDQEEELSRMKDRLLDIQAMRDDALEQVTDLKKALHRIECSESVYDAIAIARTALEENK